MSGEPGVADSPWVSRRNLGQVATPPVIRHDGDWLEYRVTLSLSPVYKKFMATICRKPGSSPRSAVKRRASSDQQRTSPHGTDVAQQPMLLDIHEHSMEV
ncbi:hypothetical protein [Sorangium cellulosum]|uniref:hypothetical protein n=1 Tax=Sorangium cellulosum TaxID=56 RepID=UPI0012FF5D26|nr:hypothetical protein [Sorangium cellulosum]